MVHDLCPVHGLRGCDLCRSGETTFPNGVSEYSMLNTVLKSAQGTPLFLDRRASPKAKFLAVLDSTQRRSHDNVTNHNLCSSCACSALPYMQCGRPYRQPECWKSRPQIRRRTRLRTRRCVVCRRLDGWND